MCKAVWSWGLMFFPAGIRIGCFADILTYLDGLTTRLGDRERGPRQIRLVLSSVESSPGWLRRGSREGEIGSASGFVLRYITCGTMTSSPTL